MAGVDWWDAVGCTQSAAEDGIGDGVGDVGPEAAQVAAGIRRQQLVQL